MDAGFCVEAYREAMRVAGPTHLTDFYSKYRGAFFINIVQGVQIWL